MTKVDVSKLGLRKFSESTNMMAGYYSHYTHSKVFELLRDKIAPGSFIADVGAGEGAFSERLTREHYKVTAIEKYCDFKSTGTKLYKLNLNDTWSDEIAERFNAVVCIEIIEHIENPFNFLRQIRNILEEDGIVFISTPNTLNFESRFRLFRYGHIEMMSHPDHRSPIFPETMIKFCRETGFEVLSRHYDIDTLSVKGRTIRTRILRFITKSARRLLVKDEYSVGNSSIWILKLAVPQKHIP